MPRKANIFFIMSAHLYSLDNTAPIGRIFLKFCIVGYFLSSFFLTSCQQLISCIIRVMIGSESKIRPE